MQDSAKVKYICLENLNVSCTPSLWAMRCAWMIERTPKFHILEEGKIETKPDQRVWRPSVNEAVTRGHDAVAGHIQLHQRKKEWIAIVEEKRTKIIHQHSVFRRDWIRGRTFFFREERSETPANEGFVAATILHDVRPRIKGRKNNNINKIQIK